jgi:hypothetical protein
MLTGCKLDVRERILAGGLMRRSRRKRKPLKSNILEHEFTKLVKQLAAIDSDNNHLLHHQIFSGQARSKEALDRRDAIGVLTAIELFLIRQNIESRALSLIRSALLAVEVRGQAVGILHLPLKKAGPKIALRPTPKPSDAVWPAPEHRKPRDEFEIVKLAMPDLIRLHRYRRRAWSSQQHAVARFICIKEDLVEIKRYELMVMPNGTETRGFDQGL